MLPETPIFDGANPDFLLRFRKIFTGNLLGVSNFLGRAEAEALMKDLPYLNRSSDISRKQWHYESLVLLQLSNWCFGMMIGTGIQREHKTCRNATSKQFKRI